VSKGDTPASVRVLRLRNYASLMQRGDALGAPDGFQFGLDLNVMLDRYARLLAAAQAVREVDTPIGRTEGWLGRTVDDLSRLVAELEGEK